MRQFVVWVLVIGGLVPWGTETQAGVGQTPAQRPSACALLTKDVLTQTSPYGKQQLDLVLSVPPMEDPVGQAGSACSYGGVTMQIDPFAWATLEQTKEKGWAPLSGVGDAAIFRDNRGNYAELGVRAGQRVLTIQMSVPDGRTAIDIQPNTIALAKAILAKLR
jgi:hypothetical protein